MEAVEKSDGQSKSSNDCVWPLICSVIALLEVAALAYLIFWITEATIEDPDILLPALDTLRWTAIGFGILVGGTFALLIYGPFGVIVIVIMWGALICLGLFLFMVAQGWWFLLTEPFRVASRLFR